jgi:hypothetical protein
VPPANPRSRAPPLPQTIQHLPLSDGSMVQHPVFDLLKVTAFMLHVKIWPFPGFRRSIHNCKEGRHVSRTHEIFANCLDVVVHIDAILFFRRVQPENCVVIELAICILSDNILRGKLHVSGRCL